MKVYKSKIMGLISKNAVKARKFKRGTVERYGSVGAFFEIERGKVTFNQGKYAIESAISTSVKIDDETKFYRCYDELYFNPAIMFEIDSCGNVVQDECKQDRAFEVFSKPCDFHDIICMDRDGDGIFTRFDRKLLIEILSYFDESSVKMRLIDHKRGGVKMLQIQDSKTKGILMPMKDEK